MLWIVDLGLAYRQPSQLEGGMSSSMFLKLCYLLSEWFFCISVKACCITFQGHLVIKDFVEVIEFGTPCIYVNCIPFCVAKNKMTPIPSYIDLFDRLGLAH